MHALPLGFKTLKNKHGRFFLHIVQLITQVSLSWHSVTVEKIKCCWIHEELLKWTSYGCTSTTNQPSPSFSSSVLTHPFPCRTRYQKPTVADLFKKSLAFTTCRFTVFVKPRHLSRFWTRWIQYTPSVLSSTPTPLSLWFCDGKLVCIFRLFYNMLREVIIVITSCYKWSYEGH